MRAIAIGSKSLEGEEKNNENSHQLDYRETQKKERGRGVRNERRKRRKQQRRR